MADYFDKFPLIRYDIDRNKLTREQLITNILFRIDFIREILDNISSYNLYAIQDGDTPEILAEKIYGNPEAHWLILYANKIIDPHYDWPMNSRSFNRYMYRKYATAYRAAVPNTVASVKNIIAWTQTQPYTYYKIVKLFNVDDEIETIRRYEVDKEPISAADLNTNDVKYDTYQDNPSFPDISTNLAETEYNEYTVGGKLVQETISREMISIFDYELQTNEDKRLIKIIKPQYYTRIYTEFERLTGVTNDNSLRRLS